MLTQLLRSSVGEGCITAEFTQSDYGCSVRDNKFRKDITGYNIRSIQVRLCLNWEFVIIDRCFANQILLFLGTFDKLRIQTKIYLTVHVDKDVFDGA